VQTAAVVFWVRWTSFGLVSLTSHGRSQYIHRRMQKSPAVQLVCDVLQGLVLDPILVGLIEKHGFCPHLYIDDTQIHGSCKPSIICDFQEHLSAWTDDVHSWMQSNSLQLNANKSELLWSSARRRWHQLLPQSAFRTGSDTTITPSTMVRDLGIFIDTDLST